ncbi:UNVERIFIED_ORG: hypothetical protein EC838_4123, partial [Providencia alcalifaciens]
MVTLVFTISIFKKYCWLIWVYLAFVWLDTSATMIRFLALAIAEVMMKKARFTETQIVNILKLADS